MDATHGWLQPEQANGPAGQHWQAMWHVANGQPGPVQSRAMHHPVPPSTRGTVQMPPPTMQPPFMTNGIDNIIIPNVLIDQQHAVHPDHGQPRYKGQPPQHHHQQQSNLIRNQGLSASTGALSEQPSATGSGVSVGGVGGHEVNSRGGGHQAKHAELDKRGILGTHPTKGSKGSGTNTPRAPTPSAASNSNNISSSSSNPAQAANVTSAISSTFNNNSNSSQTWSTVTHHEQISVERGTPTPPVGVPPGSVPPNIQVRPVGPPMHQQHQGFYRPAPMVGNPHLVQGPPQVPIQAMPQGPPPQHLRNPLAPSPQPPGGVMPGPPQHAPMHQLAHNPLHTNAHFTHQPRPPHMMMQNFAQQKPCFKFRVQTNRRLQNPASTVQYSSSDMSRFGNSQLEDIHHHQTTTLPQELSQHLRPEPPYIPPVTTPWIPKDKQYKKGSEGLTEEIKDFLKYIETTPEEQFMRLRVIHRIRRVVKEVFPQASVKVFGSFKTGLYLPTSDIDISIIHPDLTKNKPESRRMLHKLKEALIESKLEIVNPNEPDTIKVLENAAVPIIKLRDWESSVQVDLSFNIERGVQTVTLVKKYLQKYPCLKSLVFVLKQFLLQRDLNEVWTGGLSSYSIVLLVVSFLQNMKECVPETPTQSMTSSSVRLGGFTSEVQGTVPSGAQSGRSQPTRNQSGSLNTSQRGSVTNINLAGALNRNPKDTEADVLSLLGKIERDATYESPRDSPVSINIGSGTDLHQVAAVLTDHLHQDGRLKRGSDGRSTDTSRPASSLATRGIANMHMPSDATFGSQVRSSSASPAPLRPHQFTSLQADHQVGVRIPSRSSSVSPTERSSQRRVSQSSSSSSFSFESSSDSNHSDYDFGFLNSDGSGDEGHPTLPQMTPHVLLRPTSSSSTSSTAPDQNLGILLIYFFELYGKHFAYKNMCISVRNGGHYITKTQMSMQMRGMSEEQAARAASQTHSDPDGDRSGGGGGGGNGNGGSNSPMQMAQDEMFSGSGMAPYEPGILSIEDPLLISNDVGKGSYAAGQVRQAYDYAFRVILRAIHTRIEASRHQRLEGFHRSSLSRILRITDEVVRYRKWIKEFYAPQLKEYEQRRVRKRAKRQAKEIASSKQRKPGKEMSDASNGPQGAMVRGDLETDGERMGPSDPIIPEARHIRVASTPAFPTTDNQQLGIQNPTLTPQQIQQQNSQAQQTYMLLNMLLRGNAGSQDGSPNAPSPGSGATIPVMPTNLPQNPTPEQLKRATQQQVMEHLMMSHMANNQLREQAALQRHLHQQAVSREEDSSEQHLPGDDIHAMNAMPQAYLPLTPAMRLLLESMTDLEMKTSGNEPGQKPGQPRPQDLSTLVASVSQQVKNDPTRPHSQPPAMPSHPQQGIQLQTMQHPQQTGPHPSQQQQVQNMVIAQNANYAVQQTTVGQLPPRSTPTPTQIHQLQKRVFPQQQSQQQRTFVAHPVSAAQAQQGAFRSVDFQQSSGQNRSPISAITTNPLAVGQVPSPRGQPVNRIQRGPSPQHNLETVNALMQNFRPTDARINTSQFQQYVRPVAHQGQPTTVHSVHGTQLQHAQPNQAHMAAHMTMHQMRQHPVVQAATEIQRKEILRMQEQAAIQSMSQLGSQSRQYTHHIPLHHQQSGHHNTLPVNHHPGVQRHPGDAQGSSASSDHDFQGTQLNMQQPDGSNFETIRQTRAEHQTRDENHWQPINDSSTDGEAADDVSTDAARRTSSGLPNRLSTRSASVSSGSSQNPASTASSVSSTGRETPLGPSLNPTPVHYRSEIASSQPPKVVSEAHHHVGIPRGVISPLSGTTTSTVQSNPMQIPKNKEHAVTSHAMHAVTPPNMITSPASNPNSATRVTPRQRARPQAVAIKALTSVIRQARSSPKTSISKDHAPGSRHDEDRPRHSSHKDSVSSSGNLNAYETNSNRGLTRPSPSPSPNKHPASSKMSNNNSSKRNGPKGKRDSLGSHSSNVTKNPLTEIDPDVPNKMYQDRPEQSSQQWMNKNHHGEIDNQSNTSSNNKSYSKRNRDDRPRRSFQSETSSHSRSKDSAYRGPRPSNWRDDDRPSNTRGRGNNRSRNNGSRKRGKGRHTNEQSTYKNDR